ncbi:non-ribosomal peptide synthetase [Brevibacillus laterosporus]|uniref:Amino acid adenylation domain-containing protein n=1 Tax=Brevibacillus laterosporus TaxID=1465 RepID=A0AAP3DDS9_BRELA|nr:amino acid adenylation domain-containing protein [Brevibacillus laterosporus]MCR8979384.1 amino acid adenylation domain-containing protein [Brevibacillus laterosporus]MCZ0806539.1 amino acid adenylation domain-containing protein [Brevibacillus laterosporus]MCZ0824987.1 amino acid adenylation domain-containing protein [Brevibacillus laterosporus]MCZ0849850.1 amino acid adenylation domain-containing protein [Brevibacillus laterosporus]
MRDTLSQSSTMTTGKWQEEQQYWLGKLQGNVVASGFPEDFTRTRKESTRSVYKAVFPAELSEKVIATSNGSAFGMYVLLVTGVKLLLSHYTGSEDILVGMPPFQMKRSEDTANHLLALRTFGTKNDSFAEWAGKIKQTVMEADQHPNLSFAEAVRMLHPEINDPSQVNMQTVVLLDSVHDVGDIDNIESKTFFLFRAVGNSLEIELHYDSECYQEETIQRIVQHALRLLQQALSNPKQPSREIEFLSEQEKNQLIFGFNQTQSGYPQDKTIVQLFEEQAKKHSDREALVCDDQRMTYEELNRRANQVARSLTERGIEPNDIVGIMVERSLEMIVGILGIVKAGAAYLPIDPIYPQDRINYMLEDSGAKLLLTDRPEGKVSTYPGTIIHLRDENLEKYASENLSVEISPQSLAYIIYTSGTTGHPKGVMIEHRHVVRLFFPDTPLFSFTHQDVWTLFHSFSFDFSVWEIFGALLFGGKLVVVPKLVAQDTKVFLQLLQSEQVTVLNQTPTAFYQIINEEVKSADQNLNMRYVIFGGEALTPRQLQPWKAKYPQTKLINMYGITEITVHATFRELIEEDFHQHASNIGKPIPTLSIYVLDQERKLLPIGVPGEMYVSGAGVARGYLNRQELTQERFIDNPYIAGERMYKTGDLARWLADGTLEYMGRLDHQVKIRGHRIELGEIEEQLLLRSFVQEAVVIARQNKDGINELCAYLVATEDIGNIDVRKALSVSLPDYMLPTYMVQIEKMPLTPNGKIDRKALPKPENSLGSKQEYVAPRTSLEASLVSIWEDVLEIKPIGIKDNFFELGGYSLKMLKMINLVAQELNVEIPLKLLYENPTIEYMAERAFAFYMEESNNHMTLLNRAGDIKVICFPPINGFIFIYKRIAELLDQEATFYGFEYLEEENRIELYTQQILDAEPEGPYIFLGYSAGGNLAFEVAKAMEEKGHTVSDIIMFDTYMKTEQMKMTPEELEDEIERFLQLENIREILDFSHGDEVVKERILKKTRAYVAYFLQLAHVGQVHASIHFVQAEPDEANIAQPADLQMWGKFTKGTYREYQGAGMHYSMFNGHFLQRNAKMVQRILQQIKKEG